MPDNSSGLSEVTQGVRSILDRLAEFFHIFDLSFFVGGASTFGALSFLYVLMERRKYFPFAPWVGVVAVILSCYVCGLIAFAAGRDLNGLTLRKRTLAKTLPAAIAAHQLSNAQFHVYLLGETPRLWRLYIRMWSDIAHKGSMPVVTQHLMRYWAMAATYDTVAFSFLVWGGVFVATYFKQVAPHPISFLTMIVGLTASLLCAFLSLRRGAAYFEYQIEDVVAHFATQRSSLV